MKMPYPPPYVLPKLHWLWNEISWVDFPPKHNNKSSLFDVSLLGLVFTAAHAQMDNPLKQGMPNTVEGWTWATTVKIGEKCNKIEIETHVAGITIDITLTRK